MEIKNLSTLITEPIAASREELSELEIDELIYELIQMESLGG